MPYGNDQPSVFGVATAASHVVQLVVAQLARFRMKLFKVCLGFLLGQAARERLRPCRHRAGRSEIRHGARRNALSAQREACLEIDNLSDDFVQTILNGIVTE